jgi:hypothetical protein
LAASCPTVNPIRCGGQGERRGQRGVDPRLVRVDAVDSDRAELGGPGQVVQDAVGEEADVNAVDGGAELSLMSPGAATISGNLSSVRPTLRSLVLCAVASNRSTCSPLV